MKELRTYMFSCSRKEYKEILRLLEQLDIKFKDGGIVVTFEMDVSSDLFCETDRKMSELGIASTSILKYEKKEYDNAEYLRLFDFTSCGYPVPKVMPGEGESYITNMYDDSLMCRSCYGQRLQVSPLKLEAMKKSRIDGVWGVYWLNDILVTTQSFYENYLSSFSDIELGDILNAQTGEKMISLAQTRIKNILPVQLHISNKNTYRCNTCGFEKIIRNDGSILSMENKMLSGNFYLSQESFGEGFFSDRMIIVSQTIYRLLKSMKIKFRAEPVF